MKVELSPSLASPDAADLLLTDPVRRCDDALASSVCPDRDHLRVGDLCRRSAPHVLALRDEPEMGRVDAGSLLAQVVDDKPPRDRTVVRFPGNAMSASRVWPHVDFAVAVGESRELPNPAGGRVAAVGDEVVGRAYASARPSSLVPSALSVVGVDALPMAANELAVGRLGAAAAKTHAHYTGGYHHEQS